MPQRCAVCSHKKTREIEQQIVQGKAHTQIAEQHGINSQSVWYHAENHLPKKLVRSVQRKNQKHAENMLDGINDLLDRTRTILDQAEKNDQNSLALKAIKEARSTYELLSKIAVKLEEYRRADEDKKEGYARQHISEGLKSLSDDELKAYVQLQAKIYEADPNYELDPKARLIVDAVSRGYASSKPDKTGADGIGTSYQPDRTNSDSPRNRSSQDRNNQRTRSNAPDEPDVDFEELDDLDFDDLSLDEDNIIPSEETDPDWLREERRRRRRRG